MSDHSYGIVGSIAVYAAGAGFVVGSVVTSIVWWII